MSDLRIINAKNMRVLADIWIISIEYQSSTLHLFSVSTADRFIAPRKLPAEKKQESGKSYIRAQAVR